MSARSTATRRSTNDLPKRVVRVPDADPQICVPPRGAVRLGMRLANAIGRAGSRDAALQASVELLAKEMGVPVAALSRNDGMLAFVAEHGMATHARRRLQGATRPDLRPPGATLHEVVSLFASAVGADPDVVDLGAGVLLLGERCPEIVASRAELTAAISVLPAAVDRAISAEGAAAPSESNALRTLTPREREVLELLADGYGTRQIADKLVISDKTVKTHVQNILAKLGVASRLEAVASLRRAGAPLG